MENNENTQSSKAVKNAKKKENPYLSAQLAWRDYIGSFVGSRNLMIVFTLLSLASTLLAVAGLVYSSSQNKLVPYIVEVDKFGRSQFMGTVPDTNFNDPRFINVMLTDFISDFKTVSIDKELTVKALKRLYAKLPDNSSANAKVSQYFTADKEKMNPFVRSERETVVVDVKTILRSTSSSYLVEWTEYLRAPSGEMLGEQYFKANVTIELRDTSKFGFNALLENPIGLYVIDFSMQQL